MAIKSYLAEAKRKSKKEDKDIYEYLLYISKKEKRAYKALDFQLILADYVLGTNYSNGLIELKRRVTVFNFEKIFTN